MKFKSIVILGRQPALGIAELESLFGAEAIQPFGKSSCLLTIDHSNIPFDRLGGSVRAAKIMSTLPSTNWHEIETFLLKNTPKYAAPIDGKLTFGISTFGMKIPSKSVAACALKVKKAVKQTDHSVRMVPHKGLSLGSAVVLHNKLTSKNAWELLVISDGKTAYLAQTTHIQNIDAYSARDQARPHRDAKVGMLPPKLAQIIVNLATRGASEALILDPFCGTGVLLQEAMLMDYDIYGSDVDGRMVQYSIDNLAWLDKSHPDKGNYRRVELGDATTHTWHDPENIKAVACETYLGQPLSALPPRDHLSKIMQDVNALHHKFLLNIAKQLTSETLLCLAVPAWRGKYEFLHLPVLDHLTDMGYTLRKFKHVSRNDLLYHREDQIVARELVVLRKN